MEVRGSGLSSCLMPRTSCGWESYPVSIVGTSGAVLFLWGRGRDIISWPPLEESARALGKLGSNVSESWPVSGEAAES